MNDVENITNEPGLISIGIYIYGDKLDPNKITHLVGEPPTYSHRKGEILKRGSKTYAPKKTSVWVQRHDYESTDVDECLKQYFDKFSVFFNYISKNRFDSLPDIEEKKLDIYLDPNEKINFVISTETMKKLFILDSEIEFTIHVCDGC